MDKRMTGKEINRYMDYLVKLLHKEWGRSGGTRAEVRITLEDAAPVYKKLARQIAEKQDMQETEGMTFQEGMDLSKECFILLRLAKKVKKAEEKAYRKGMDEGFLIKLDVEEYRMFQKLINASGKKSSQLRI